MTIRFHINVGAYTSYLVERRKNVKFRLRVRSTNPHLPNLDVVSRPFVTKSLLGRNISSADRYVAAAPAAADAAEDAWPYAQVTDTREFAHKAKRPRTARSAGKVAAP